MILTHLQTEVGELKKTKIQKKYFEIFEILKRIFFFHPFIIVHKICFIQKRCKIFKLSNVTYIAHFFIFQNVPAKSIEYRKYAKIHFFSASWAYPTLWLESLAAVTTAAAKVFYEKWNIQNQ